MRLVFILLIIIGLGTTGYGVWSLVGPGGQYALIEAPITSGASPDDAAETTESFDEPAPAVMMPRSFTSPDDEDTMVETATAEANDLQAQRDALLAQLETVPIAYEKPSEVDINTPFDVTLAIDAAGNVTAVEALPNEGEVVETEIQVSSTVSATLTGSGFDIVALSTPKQTLSPLETNRWQWKVTAVRDGDRDLVLEIFAHIDGQPTPVRTFRDQISVNVSRLSEILALASSADPIVAVAGGLGSMLAGLFGIARFFRRRPG